MADYKLIRVRVPGQDEPVFAMIDPEDQLIVEGYPWHTDRKGYVRYNPAPGKYIFLHRLVKGCSLYDGKQVDHENRDKLDCRKKNLRFATTSQNCQNRPSIGGTSQYRGVSWKKKNNKWQASGKINGKSTYLGLFINELDAAKAASDWRKENHTHYIESELV